MGEILKLKNRSLTAVIFPATDVDVGTLTIGLVGCFTSRRNCF